MSNEPQNQISPEDVLLWQSIVDETSKILEEIGDIEDEEE